MSISYQGLHWDLLLGPGLRLQPELADGGGHCDPSLSLLPFLSVSMSDSLSHTPPPPTPVMQISSRRSHVLGSGHPQAAAAPIQLCFWGMSTHPGSSCPDSSQNKEFLFLNSVMITWSRKSRRERCGTKSSSLSFGSGGARSLVGRGRDLSTQEGEKPQTCPVLTQHPKHSPVK